MSARIENLYLPARPTEVRRGKGWSTRFAFVLAAAGSAVGLGNVWKFPYIAGEHGGGAFVLVYLACVMLIGLPILIAEIVLGRRGGSSPIHGLRALASREGRSPNWRYLGWLGVAGTFLILSFYSVVAGWSIAYLWYAVSGQFGAAAADSAASAGALFAGLKASPATMLACHALAMAATVLVVARGIRNGLERAVRWMVPGLFVLLVALVIYAAVATGEFGRAAAFMFRPDFSALSWDAVLVALGHAFFTLSVGMTAMMAYGSHLEKKVSVAKASVAIAGLDTLVALLACLAVFPIVFANGLQTEIGPGLLFVTMPIAFGQMPGGEFAGMLFFLFLGLAALTSTISLLEPTVEHLEQRAGWNRRRAAALSGLAIWIVGIGSVLAFNLWSGFTPFGKNLFDLLDFVTANLMLPIGGLLIAIFAGWGLSRASLAEELGLGESPVFRLWRFVLRYVAVPGVVLVLVYNLL